jgi:hypothetical protein
VLTARQTLALTPFLCSAFEPAKQVNFPGFFVSLLGSPVRWLSVIRVLLNRLPVNRKQCLPVVTSPLRIKSSRVSNGNQTFGSSSVASVIEETNPQNFSGLPEFDESQFVFIK